MTADTAAEVIEPPRVIRDDHGRWLPGTVSVSPGRPPAWRTVRDMCRLHSTEAVETLLAIMRDPERNDATRVVAARIILDRAWGTSDKETKVAKSNPHDFKTMPTDELNAVIDSVGPLARAVRLQCEKLNLSAEETEARLQAAFVLEKNPDGDNEKP